MTEEARNIALAALEGETRYDGSPFIEHADGVARIVSERANSTDSRFKRYQDRRNRLGGGFSALENPNQIADWQRESSWQAVKIFQFGVMSYLMPRYLFMLGGINNLDDLDKCAQWTARRRTTISASC